MDHDAQFWVSMHSGKSGELRYMFEISSYLRLCIRVVQRHCKCIQTWGVFWKRCLHCETPRLRRKLPMLMPAILAASQLAFGNLILCYQHAAVRISRSTLMVVDWEYPLWHTFRLPHSFHVHLFYYKSDPMSNNTRCLCMVVNNQWALIMKLLRNF